MSKSYLKIGLVFLLIAGCGGGRKLAKNPQVIGVVPFAVTPNTSTVDDANRQILLAFRDSGVLIPRPVGSTASYWDLPRMKAFQDTLIRFVLTGTVVYEDEGQEKASKIPFLLHKPNAVYSVKLAFRLYSVEKGGWEDVGEIIGKHIRKGDYQVLDYDPADPSLAVDARDRQIFRRDAYRAAANQLIDRIAKKLKVE